MIGLPFEEDDDLRDIIDLAEQITRLSGKKGRRETVNVSISTFRTQEPTPLSCGCRRSHWRKAAEG